MKILYNTRKMAPTLAFHFLSLVLFFVTMGEGIIVEDLKIELPDQKDIEETKQSNHLHHSIDKAKQLDYDYKVNIHDHNSWLPWSSRETKKPNSYYEVNTRDPNPWRPWGNRETKKPNHDYEVNIRDPNPWLPWGSRESKKPNYDYEVNTRDPNSWSPWGSRESKKPNYNYEVNTRDPNSWSPWGSRESKKPNYDYEVNTRDPNSWSPWGSRESKKPNYDYEVNTRDPNSWSPWGSRESKKPNYDYEVNTRDPNSWSPWGSRETKKPNYDYEVYPNSWSPWGSRKTKKSNYDYEVNTRDPNPWRPWGSRESKKPQYNYKVKTHDPSPDHTEAFEKGFFNLEDLHVGNVMTLQFSHQEIPHFFSRKEEADSIPFSVSQLSSVLQLFSIPEDSLEAKIMKGTLEHCQEETVIGETKICANSVESMFEFVDKIIGSENKQNILRTSYPSPTAAPLQKYTILKVSHDIDAPKWVSCHPLPYPYAIYYCHTMATGTKVFKVTLVGDKNGDKMEALGMCHLDTADWDPNHMIFRTLRVKPGKNTPVCHFFSINHLLWVPLPNSKVNI